MTEDYLCYYDLENYLFEDVHKRFHENKKLDAFDLFSIIVWKANRAKSKLAHRLLKKSQTLEEAASEFTGALYRAQSAQQRLLIAMDEWGFYLPMASAILAVLWPEEFTVYDYRVCEELNDFRNLRNLETKNLWPKYCQYREAVRGVEGAEGKSLRETDRFLWGRSAAFQLKREIENGFPKTD